MTQPPPQLLRQLSLTPADSGRPGGESGRRPRAGWPSSPVAAPATAPCPVQGSRLPRATRRRRAAAAAGPRADHAGWTADRSGLRGAAGPNWT